MLCPLFSFINLHSYLTCCGTKDDTHAVLKEAQEVHQTATDDVGLTELVSVVVFVKSAWSKM